MLNDHLTYLVTVSTRNPNNMRCLFRQEPTFQVQINAYFSACAAKHPVN